MMDQVVVGEGGGFFRLSDRPELFRMESDRAVSRHGKKVPVARLYQSVIKKLPYNLQCIDGLLCFLCRETIHKVGVDQDSRLREISRHPGRISDGNPFIDQFQDAVGSHFQSPRHGNTTRCFQQPA